MNNRPYSEKWAKVLCSARKAVIMTLRGLVDDHAATSSDSANTAKLSSVMTKDLLNILLRKKSLSTMVKTYFRLQHCL